MQWLARSGMTGTVEPLLMLRNRQTERQKHSRPEPFCDTHAHSEWEGHRVSRVDFKAGLVTAMAGCGLPGFRDGPALEVRGCVVRRGLGRLGEMKGGEGAGGDRASAGEGKGARASERQGENASDHEINCLTTQHACQMSTRTVSHRVHECRPCSTSHVCWRATRRAASSWQTPRTTPSVSSSL